MIDVYSMFSSFSFSFLQLKPLKINSFRFFSLKRTSFAKQQYPMDVLRRRMQTFDGVGSRYSSVTAGLREIVAEEGIRRGLYRGLTLNYLKTIPNVMIYMSLYDIFKQQLFKLRDGARL